MKLHTFHHVAAAGLLASAALAHEDHFAHEDGDAFEKIGGSTSTETLVAEPSNTLVIEHPPVPVLNIPERAVLFEQFQGNTERWKASNAKKDDEFSYVGEWAIEEATVLPGFSGDKGLVVKSPAAHHAISAKFDKPLDNTGKTLIVQYEVKFQEGLECGGAYVKLLSENEALHAEEFSNASPYQIMFGPDKCGSTNKVHFIIQRKDPNTGEYGEKHLSLPPPAKLNKLSNLYTLIITPENQFEVRINGDVVRAGSLLEDGTFRPGFNPLKEVLDPEDVKPEDWVENQRIPDPEQPTKPDDWDEDAPLYIVDPEAIKPEDWNEDLELLIPDPEAEIPEDWDEEEDGEWIAPLIDNPECETLSGCGPWKAPTIRNPEYRGPWVRPTIENPEYKGEWSPRLIPNPDYYEDTTVSNLEPIGAIGFELWTMQADILFDNIYVGHSVDEAEFIGNQTYVVKHALEAAEEKATLPPPTEKKEKTHYSSQLEFFKEHPIEYLRMAIVGFSYAFNQDPVNAITSQPLVAIAFAAGFSVFFAGVFGFLGIFSMLVLNKVSNDNDKKKEKARKEAASKEKIVEVEDSATTTGSASKTSATKRKA